MRKAKIIATVGPSSFAENVLLEMVRSGADAFRLNFAHGTYEEKLNDIKIIRSIEKKVKKYIPIIGDLQGPVIRLGVVDAFSVRKGESVKIVNKKVGNAAEKEVPIPDKDLFSMLDDDDFILIESGRIIIHVDKVADNFATGKVLLDGTIKSEKTVAIKGKDIPLPTLNEKDIKDAQFIIKSDFDYIGLSFVRDTRDVKELRDFLTDHGATDIKIISKIETKRAVDSITNIVKESDAILVARGDLAIYYDLEQIPKIQDRIVKTSRALGRPVVIATQLLESMTANPMPTRAEVVDVSNAVWEDVDALMLAGETAIGKYPVECIIWLDKIIREAEHIKRLQVEPKEETVYDNFAQGIVEMAKQIEAKIIAYTKGGNTGFRLARYRPEKPFYLFTSKERIARQLQLAWGTRAFVIDEHDPEEAFPKIIEHLKKQNELEPGDIVILTAGLSIGATDTIKIEKIRKQEIENLANKKLAKGVND